MTVLLSDSLRLSGMISIVIAQTKATCFNTRDRSFIPTMLGCSSPTNRSEFQYGFVLFQTKFLLTQFHGSSIDRDSVARCQRTTKTQAAMRAGVQVASASCRTVASGCRHRDGLNERYCEVAVGSVRLGARLACEVGNPHSELLRREGKTPCTPPSSPAPSGNATYASRCAGSVRRFSSGHSNASALASFSGTGRHHSTGPSLSALTSLQ